MGRANRFVPRIAATALALGIGVAASMAPLSSAKADDWRYHHGYDHRHWSDNRSGGGSFYFTTPGYYYAPPPAYYYPPPAYVYPAPAPSFGFSVRIH